MGSSFLLGLSLIITSCKKHLTKGNAEVQIISSRHFPIVADYTFTKKFTTDQNTEGRGVTIILGEEEFAEQEKMIKTFEKNHLVAFEETPYREETTAFLMGTTVRTWTDVIVSLTDEGKKYLLSENTGTFRVKLWRTNFEAITSIQELQKGKSAQVNYTVSNKSITTFGECFENKSIKTQNTTYFSYHNGRWISQSMPPIRYGN